MVRITSNTPAECIFTNDLGTDYAELSCLDTFFKPFYLEFENGINNGMWKIMSNNNWFPVAACALYALLIAWGQYVMKSREPWKGSRPYLAAWNFCLSAFSFLGSFRVGCNVFYNLSTLSIRDNFCLNPAVTYGSGATGLWIQMFILSKFPELFDTFFVIVNKKPLIFLHWYHHITVLLFCWHSYITFSTGGLFFAFMNYTVHAFMYGYYFLMAIRRKPKWLHPIFITTIQIIQMIGGVTLTCLTTYYYKTEKEGECYVEKKNITAALIMYMSYLALFLKFFFKRYSVKSEVRVGRLAQSGRSSTGSLKKQEIAGTKKTA